MKQKQFVISDEFGIHARPAGMLVKEMQSYPCNIIVEKSGKTVDGKKLFALMGLSVKQGETITIIAEGEMEEEAISGITKVFEETGL